jgi:tetratricopeptide (TPR) repeat protein
MDELPLRSRRFRVVRCIGSGATGVVYEAHDRDLGADVAIKLLRQMHPRAITRFKQEFRALQDLEHPNLVGFGELLEEDGQLLFTMELVRGVDFLSYVRPRAAGELVSYDTAATSASDRTPVVAARPSPGMRLDEARLRHALAELGRGLSALHGAGKVHRDVKPSNVLITAEGRVVLLDFGLLVDEATEDSWSSPAIVGTPLYMAPEQAAGRELGPAADWYAVGVMLYEALTGRAPFEGAPMKVILDKQRDEPPPIKDLAPTAPPDLEALCLALLRFDPAARPDGETFLRRLGATAAAQPARARRPSATFTQGPPFVGRQGELALLEDELAVCAVRGRAGVVLIRGESGVGKSTLVRVFTRALDASVVVASGRCFERESVAYKAFDGVVDALARRLAHAEPAEAAALLPFHAGLLAQVFPALRRVKAFADAPPPGEAIDQRELRVRVFGALRELLGRLCQRHPVVVAIDDLQWADEDSLALLTEVLRPPEAPPLLLLATLRPTAREGAADAGARVRAVCPDAGELQLGPLSAGESRQLASMLLDVHGVKEPIDVEILSQEAAGHPLFIDELVRHAAGFGAHAGGVHLEDVLWQRVEALEPKAREVLELVCLAGSPIHLDALGRAAEVNAERLGRLVSLLRVSNLVRTTGVRAVDTVEPYHDRVRHAIASRQDGERRQAVHRALALAIEGSPYPGQESMLAFHWKGAGRDELAARYAASAAGRAAEAFAFDRAARFYRTALELGHPDRADLLARLGEALANAGRGAEAADAYLGAASIAGDEATALDLRRHAAEQLLMSGHIERGIELFTGVLGAAGMTLPQSPRGALASLVWHRARIALRGLGFKERQESAVAATELTRVDLCWSVATGLAMVDSIRGADFQTRHLLLALRAGEPTRVARALAIEGGFLSTGGAGARRRGKKLFAAARRLLERTPSPQTEALLLGAECIAAYQGGQWRRALELARQAEHRLRNQRESAGWQLDTMEFFWLYSLFYLGELRELAARAPARLRVAIEHGDLYAATNLRVGLINAAWLATGDVEAARRHLEDAERQWTKSGFHVQHFHQLVGRGQIHLYAGEAGAGYRLVTERWRDFERSMLDRVRLLLLEAQYLRARLALAMARARPGEAPRYLREAEGLARRLRTAPETFAAPWGDVVAAAVARARGDHEGAVAALDRAASGFTGSDMAVYAAAARWRLGALLGGDEGAEMARGAVGELEGQAVAEPERFMAMLAPGFD